MKTVIGKIISAKMQNTVVVEVSRLTPHPLYKKRISRRSRFHAHNAVGAKTGDTVRLIEVKPMSKTKNWKVEVVL